MPRYRIDPETGAKVQISGTGFVAPCLAKTAARKATQAAAVAPEPPAAPQDAVPETETSQAPEPVSDSTDEV